MITFSKTFITYDTRDIALTETEITKYVDNQMDKDPELIYDEWDLKEHAHEFALDIYMDADHPDGDYYDEAVDIENLDGYEIEELEDFILNYLMDNYAHTK